MSSRGVVVLGVAVLVASVTCILLASILGDRNHLGTSMPDQTRNFLLGLGYEQVDAVTCRTLAGRGEDDIDCTARADGHLLAVECSIYGAGCRLRPTVR